MDSSSASMPPPPRWQARSVGEATASSSTTSYPYPSEHTRHNEARSVSTSYYSTSRSRQRRGVTPGPSAMSGRRSVIGASEGHQIVCAVSEARGVSPSVGLAFVNISTGAAVMSQICDTQFYLHTIHTMTVFEPSRILIVSTACPPQPKSNLYCIIEEEIPGIPIVALDRKYWSETAGLEFIQTLAFREDVEAIKVAIEGNFYAVCAFAAAMRYLELEFSFRIAAHSLRIKFQASEETMMIDLSTIQSLELIQNIQDAKSKACLYGHLNQTLTPMGARMLRSQILQPSTQAEAVLVPRYDAVDELCTKEDMFFEIRKVLRGLTDIETLLTKIIIIPEELSIYDTEQAINRILMVKSFVKATSAVFDSLGSARSTLLTKLRDACHPDGLKGIQGLISDVINHDVEYARAPLELRNQRTYAVKSGINGLLDVARKTYKETTNDLHEHVRLLNEGMDVAGDIKFESRRKYYLRYRVVDFEDGKPPDILINCVQKGEFVECQTLQMLKLNKRIDYGVDQTLRQSEKVVLALLDSVRQHVPHLYRLCEAVALLDMLASFAHTITAREYVRPDLSNVIALEAARHPILEQRLDKFIPNKYYASGERRLQIIMGCNMSGKSTYIKTVALLQVMAQIGCFVPASYAVFSVVHNLFSRVSTDDSIEANMSTFSVEMREMAFILRNINDKSLAIIDELGRGTSSRDGLAIAIAMAEALVQSNATVFFATHFLDLAKVLADRPGVRNLHLATETALSEGDIPTMTMLYKITGGTVQDEKYGINLARATGFPDSFLEKAEYVADFLRRQAEEKKNGSQARKLARRRKLVLNLRETLVQAYESQMDDSALASYLKRLQGEFVIRMDEIERGMDGNGAREVEDIERDEATGESERIVSVESDSEDDDMNDID